MQFGFICLPCNSDCQPDSTSLREEERKTVHSLNEKYTSFFFPPSISSLHLSPLPFPPFSPSLARSAGVSIPQNPQQRLTRHADAAEGASLVQTSALVVARVALALVDVDLAARPREALRAVTPVGKGQVRSLRICKEKEEMIWPFHGIHFINILRERRDLNFRYF